jgi:hypothetical protein
MMTMRILAAGKYAASHVPDHFGTDEYRNDAALGSSGEGSQGQRGGKAGRERKGAKAGVKRDCT